MLRGKNSKLKQLEQYHKKKVRKPLPSDNLVQPNQIFLSPKNIKNEIIISDTEEDNERTCIKEFICNLCYDKFDNKNDYFTHMNFHKEIYKSQTEWCQGCSRFYSDKKQLQTHSPCKDNRPPILKGNDKFKNQKGDGYLRNLQNEEMSFLCIYCEIKYNDVNAIKKHLVFKHSDIEPNYHCLWCNQLCSTLKIHMHKCMICSKYFYDEDRFLIHVEMYHNQNTIPEEKELNFACFYCHKRFGLIADIDIHSAVEHAERQLRYICLICNVILDLFQEHTIHANNEFNQHQNFAIYQCSYCLKSFESYNVITQHFNSSHCFTKEPIYNCLEDSKKLDVIEKKFDLIRLSKLTYACLYCVELFCSYSDIKKHIRQKHQELEKIPYYRCIKCRKNYVSNNKHLHNLDIKNNVDESINAPQSSDDKSDNQINCESIQDRATGDSRCRGSLTKFKIVSVS
ncbi:hypothetical protein ILUMI_27228 [Ignelater luminosus]|uniref:C2H2-type domain-containing protein n=1 Tax=Ignelater luminosus TaxID=2038154 RepID=A0A8K0FVQ4_IGNLU|nr:hypothetical protein ILUMI_27228 [Ignelater luminosus]